MKRLLILGLLAAPLLLTACDGGGVRETLGLNRDAPDEFTVVSRPPLSLPPEFSLRPPRPGEPPRGTSADDQARSLLTGTPVKKQAEPGDLVQPTVDTAVMPVTSSEVATGAAASLLKRAGAADADESIRSKLTGEANTPQAANVEDNAPTLYDRLTGADKAEPVVDAAKETERLRENKGAGKPVNDGEVPVESTKPKSVLDRIF
ncbi:MAG: DUF3035 domain-containing protein [Pseudomonadota bacterium]